MSALKSRVAKNRDALVIEISGNDLRLENFSLEMSQTIAPFLIAKVVINLAALDVITSKEAMKLQELTAALSLIGKDVTVCGINPTCASLIYYFVENLNFKTELNVDYAVQDISH